MHPLVETFRTRWGDSVLSLTAPVRRRAFVTVKPEAARRCVEDAWREGGRLATITGVEVRDGIEANYHLCFDEAGLVMTVRTVAPWPEPTLESVASFIPGALWIEREIHDLLGLEFVGHPDMRRLILPDEWPEGVYPLRRGFRP